MYAYPLIDGEVLALPVVRDLELPTVSADALRVPLLALEEEAGQWWVAQRRCQLAEVRQKGDFRDQWLG